MAAAKRDGLEESRLALVRRDRGMTQKDLAERAGIPVATLRRLERLEVSGKLTQYLAIANILECSVEELAEPNWLARPSGHPGQLAPGRPRPPRL